MTQDYRPKRQTELPGRTKRRPGPGCVLVRLKFLAVNLKNSAVWSRIGSFPCSNLAFYSILQKNPGFQQVKTRVL